MTLVGRDAPQEALRALLLAIPADRPPVVLVSGEAGVGKTTLVDSVVSGFPALRGRAGEWKAAAYDVLAQVLRQGTDRSPGLAPVLPELGPAGPLDRSRLAAAVRTALASGPAVVVLDDLQWADDDTLDLLPALADAVRGSPVLLVGCYRSDELPRGHRLRGMRAELRRRGLLAEVTLAPLDRVAVREMLAGLELGPAVADAIADRAEGVPFAVEELAAALADGDTGVPDGIREAVLLRTGRLSPASLPVLEAAAVLGTEFDPDAALALALSVSLSVSLSGTAADIAAGPAGMADIAAGPPGAADIPAGPAGGGGGGGGWPEELAGGGLVTAVTGGRASFRHALTRDAVYADIPWSRRRALHRAAAARLESAGAPAALVAAHLLAAHELDRARSALLTAADGFRQVHAYRDAAGALRTALDLWPAEDAGRLAVVDGLAQCAEMCSDHAESVVLLTELANGCASPPDRAGAYRRLALAHELLGQWDRALAAREAAALAFVAAGLPAESAADRLAAANHLRSAASFRAALDVLDLARCDADAADRTDLSVRIEGQRGNLLARAGRTAEGVRIVRAALDRALAAELTGPAAEIYQRLADALEHSGDHRAARTAYASAYQFCDLHDQDGAGLLCRACVTAVLFSCGEWDRAADICREVLDTDGPPHPRAVAAGILGLVHAMRGAPARARPWLLESRSIATRTELVPMELLSAWGLAVLDDQAGRPGDAAGHAGAILDRWRRTEESHYTVPVLQWASTFFATAGAGPQTRACAAALAAIAGRTAQPEARAALTHALGEAALADGDPATAAAELTAAATQFAALDLPVAALQAQHRAGVALARGGDRSAAVAMLRTALSGAQRLHADYFCAAVSAELAALGEAPGRRRSHSNPGGLSGRETEVMRLVAMGCTSKQIATELFLSPRTVEMHVQNSLVKLGCRTRTEAVRHLAELGVPGRTVPA
ncbi:MAG TPA: AAA family ATPase [Mycobacteriales bacterium]|nr:AAA family ATPase [Mycobacteriales bacterium]